MLYQRGALGADVLLSAALVSETLESQVHSYLLQLPQSHNMCYQQDDRLPHALLAIWREVNLSLSGHHVSPYTHYV